MCKNISHFILLLLLSASVFSSDLSGFDNNAVDDNRSSPKSRLVNLMSGTLVGELSEQLNHFGTIETSFIFDDSLSISQYSFDTLLPVSYHDSNLMFTQLGLRREDRRQLTNIGLGYRFTHHNWLIGYNAFHDMAWDTHSHRYGVGVELWRDNLKFSMNGYKRASGWKDSHRHDKYQERPADGWDLNIETWLQSYPQIGGRISYEKYYGENVALFSFDQRKPDPDALTVGGTYTPVPAITTSVDVKKGKYNSSAINTGLLFTYRMGVGWKEQFSPDYIKLYRTVPAMNLDLVNRNNSIVMNYKKIFNLSLSFPSEITGPEGAEYSFAPEIRSSNGIDRIELNDAELIHAGGRVLVNDGKTISLKLPYSTNSSPVHFSGVAIDARGKKSPIAETKIIPIKGHHQLDIDANKVSALADGSDQIAFTMHVKDDNGYPVPYEDVTIRTDGGQLSTTSGKTDTKGELVTFLSSNTAGEFHVTLIDGADRKVHSGVSFISSVTGNLTANKQQIWANNQDEVILSLKLANSDGQVTSGQSVMWHTSEGTLSADNSLTDDKGIATVRLKSNTPGSAIVTATHGSTEWVSEKITMKDATPVLRIVEDKHSALANGKETITFSVSVTRKDGTPLEGKKILWSSGMGTLSHKSSFTDDAGKASVSLTSEVEGETFVHAEIESENIYADSSPVKFSEVLVMFLIYTQSVHVGGTSNIALILENINREPREGATVNWSTSGGSLSEAVTLTDSNGVSYIDLTSNEKGTFTVTATVGDNKMSAKISFY
ncbi:hypothetical protein DAI21_22715 (plasmid) [Lelliottia sp. WB101]|jgi:hypothetical protein|uniref:inverse autotransporter beta domain-containing protein n=1 Tax=Lelliottia sp. WB101 TaxID=2153385 RepID=UPI000D214871|nr:inverse autotransporter beta domain-containing protein [Lelliottia sp. WB101]AVZ00433.1 hypothetical protein DAI21_22715 [Lelliottia sp. WB101]